MCVSIGPADFSDTIILAHFLEDGRNVLGYQNCAENKSKGPNAMILPIPSRDPMTSANCVDMSKYPGLFRMYVNLIKPRSRGMMKSLGIQTLGAIEVFDSGSYTVVLAADARDIPSVLEQVPENKRPNLHPEMFEAYARWYPGWPVALCCWDGEIEAEPLLWWYNPLPDFEKNHFLPGLDSHTGKVPDPAIKVDVDHALIIGVHAMSNVGTILDGVSPKVRELLPQHVYGTTLSTSLPNGDWVIPKLPPGSGIKWAERQKPPGF